MHKTDRTQHAAALAKFKAALNLIQYAKASVTTKLTIVNVSVLSALSYVTKFASWTLADYEVFDTALAVAIRRITGNRLSFPTALIFLPRNHGGLGIRRPSDLAQQYKNAIIQRAYQKGARATHVVDSLLQLGLRSFNQPSIQGMAVTLLPAVHDEENPVWATSLIEWLHRAGCTITVNARHSQHKFDPAHTLIHHIQEYRDLISEHPHRQLDLLSHDIVTLGELYMEGDDLARTREVLDMDWLPDLPAPNAAILLRPGQFWLCAIREELT